MDKRLLPSVELLVGDLNIYLSARKVFLTALALPLSGRDPLAEFSEILVHTIIGGTIAKSRVEKGYDLISPTNRKIQVKYLLNQSDKWVNEHTIHFKEDVDEYALVVFRQYRLEALIIFKRETLLQVCEKLKKKHHNQNVTLQLTQRNYDTLLKEHVVFVTLGVHVTSFQ